MQISTISSQGQTSVPAKIRKELGIKSGYSLKWEIVVDSIGGKKAQVSAASVKTVKLLRGVAKDLYRSYGGGKKYLEQERAAWDR